MDRTKSTGVIAYKRAPRRELPPLECGARMKAREFLRRYEQMPEDEKAELIRGIVYTMPHFVSVNWHGEPDSILQTWTGTYAAMTSGVKSAANATVELSADDVVQPDGLIRILPEYGGGAVIERKLLCGPPEFVFEIAFSSAAIDGNEKKETYRRNGVAEYLLWNTEENLIRWWTLEQREYRLIESEDGVLCSRVLPGLWLDVKALLKDDNSRVLGVLQKGIKSAAHRQFVRRLRAARPQK